MKSHAKILAERARGAYRCPTGEHEDRHEGRREILWCVAFAVAPQIRFTLAAPVSRVRDLHAMMASAARGDAVSVAARLEEALPEVLVPRDAVQGDIALTCRGRARRELSPDGYLIVARLFLECDGCPDGYAVQSLGRFDAPTCERIFACSDRRELDDAVRGPLIQFREQAVKAAMGVIVQRCAEGGLRP